MFKKPQAEAATLDEIMYHNARRAFFGERMTRNLDKVKPIEIWATLITVAAAAIKLYLITR